MTSSTSFTSPTNNNNEQITTNEATPYTPFTPFFKKSKARTSKKTNHNNITSIFTSDSILSSASPTTTSSTYNHNVNSLSFSFPKSIVSSKTDIVLSPNKTSIQLAPETPHILTPKRMLASDSTTLSPIFRNDVRQEWIDAMFGPDFFSNNNINDKGYTPPRQGVGLANIPSYLSYSATIPSTKEMTKQENDKVGMTLSRIPIGVYVRLVDIKSEAFAAGIVPGSVLVELNGVGVLGEPSHKLLERLWKFEGHFDDFMEGNEDDNINQSMEKDSNTGTNDGKNGVVGGDKNNKSVITLKLIKDGVLYNIVLMSGTPMGISWAPCANFALVQRTYAMAQKVGVRRGCIVAAVNDKNLRSMNHLDTAMYLKDQFEKGVAIRVVCVYTPAASRTGFHDRKNSKAPQDKSNEVRTIDGVRIRKVSLASRNKEKPTEYGVGSFFSCGTGPYYQPHSADTSLSDSDIIMDIANRVAAGEIASPTGLRGGMDMKRSEDDGLTFAKLVSEYILETNSLQETPRNDFVIKSKGDSASFPEVSWVDLFQCWDGLEALVFCLRMHAAEYNEENFFDMGGIIGVSGNDKASKERANDGNSEKYPFHCYEANAKLITSFGSCENGDAFHLYLLQLVALISSRELFERTTADLLAKNASVIDSLSGSKKKEIMRKMNAEAKAKTESILEKVVQSIVSIAMKDESLCQSLHFLLRSFSSTIVKKKVDEETDFAPIKMLTAAHCLLRNRLMDRDINGLSSVLSYESALNGDSASMITNEKNDEKKKKSKRFSKLFGRGNKKDSSFKEEDKSNDSGFHDSSEGGIEQAKVENRKQNNFKPHSILRKSADQERLDKHMNGQEAQIIDISSTPILFENMGWFLSNLDQLCGKIEVALLKSFSQKLTEWALQPWSASKDRALSDGTADMRNGLHVINLLGRSRTKENGKSWSPVINPVNPAEYLVSIIPEESYILPSAHFPLLLTFSSCGRTGSENTLFARSNIHKSECLYRTSIKIKAVKEIGNVQKDDEKKAGFSYLVHATIGGVMKETGKSSLDPYYHSSTHRWHENNIMQFETRSSSGNPGTAMLRLSSVSFQGNRRDQIAVNDGNGMTCYSSEVGFSFIQLDGMWQNKSMSKTMTVNVYDYNVQPEFDQQGFLSKDLKLAPQKLSIELEVTTVVFPCVEGNDLDRPNLRKQVLLYKHDEDMRQEMLATQFVDVCDRILKASGLDLKLKKYMCVPVGEKKGFIEWVPGAFSLSELCKPMGSAVYESSGRSKTVTSNGYGNVPLSPENETEDSAFIRSGGWCQFESLRSLRHNIRTTKKHGIGMSGNNPIQDFFRSSHYDEKAPYLIKKEVMDNFVKSCAGYSVITYLLGVGDRHTDNLLLHSNGYFLHCDYSFILGQDPKTYLPMRITQHMINGMGGKDSDNFAMFLSLSGAAFVALRRHPSVRILMSMVRSMVDAEIPDITINQDSNMALKGIYDRFRLDLNDDEAVNFLEENIERSISSKIWIAVDAIHSLGKKF